MRIRRALGGSLAFALLAFGCHLLVSSDVPDFRCGSADISSCPSGTTCDLTTNMCVSTLVEGGDELGVDGGDDGPKPDGGPAPLGANCALDSDCASSLCGTSTLLTTTIVPSGSLPICTQTCCHSGECPNGFVCFAAATGGNYCVTAEKASATPPSTGGRAGGDMCAGPTQCRSGKCVGGRCLDTCCLQGDCTPPTVCRLTSLTTPTRLAWSCGMANAGGRDAGATCAQPSDCRNDNCIGAAADRLCRPSCCNSASCAGEGFQGGVCAYTFFGTDQFKSCLTAATSAGPKPTGQACATDTECATRFCDGDTNRCADVCCANEDCPPSAPRCLPTPVGTPFLRCVP